MSQKVNKLLRKYVELTTPIYLWQSPSYRKLRWKLAKQAYREGKLTVESMRDAIAILEAQYG